MKLRELELMLLRRKHYSKKKRPVYYTNVLLFKFRTYKSETETYKSYSSVMINAINIPKTWQLISYLLANL